MACASTCPTQECPSYGACLRRKAIQIDKYSLQVGAVRLDKRKDHTLNRFEQCVRSGLTPEAPTKTEVEKAERVLNSA